MGTSSSKVPIPQDNDFYQEAYNYTTHNTEGIVVTDANNKEQNVQYYKTLNPDNPIFKQEIIENGYEQAEIKPWLTQLIPLKTAGKRHNPGTVLPNYSLKIDHIFGYHVDDMRNNLFCLPNDKILYATSSVAIIESICDNIQEIFGCDQKTPGSKYCHNAEITAIDYLESDISMIATGQRGLKPMILLWSPIDGKTIYAKYTQSRGSKEVSGVSIDPLGKYVISYGKNDNNSFFVFDIQQQKMVWKQGTDENKLLSAKYGYTDYTHNTKDEICLVGYQKIIFANGHKKTMSNILNNYPKKKNQTFTSCLHIKLEKDLFWLVGTYTGDVLKFKNCKLDDEYSSIGKSSIECLFYSQHTNMLYVSDSYNYFFIYTVSSKELKKKEKVKNNESIIKAIAVNKSGDIFQGLKNGTIRKFIPAEKSSKKVIEYEDIVQTHHEGGLYGIDLVDDKRIITTGEDNKIMVWNFKSLKCENIGIINPLVTTTKSSDKKTILTVLEKYNKSWAVSYNKGKDHVAIGICNGRISIRAGIKNLNEKVQEDIDLGRVPVTELKYTKYGNMLAVCLESKEIFFLNPNDNYKQVTKIEFANDYYATFLDWDFSGEFIQIVTNKNTYDIYSIPSLKNLNKINEDPSLLKKFEETRWPDITCKFGYNVQGIFGGSSDPDFITSCGKGKHENIIASGDEDLNLNLCNYPVLTDNCKVKKYYSHCEPIKRVLFTYDDKKLITIGGKDKSIFIWEVVEA